MITEIPLILFGSFLLIGTFVVFVYYSEKVMAMTEEDTKKIIPSLSHLMVQNVFNAIIGIINGAMIFVFTEIYRILS